MARPRSPTVAAFLSFVWPGLGQWYAGRREAALFFAVPVAAIVLLLLIWLAAGLDHALVDLLLPVVAVTFILVILAEGAWRIAALIHAAWLIGQPALRVPSVGGPVAAMTLVVVVTHLWAASVGWSLFQASGRVFEPPPVVAGPVESGAPLPSNGFLATPQATPETKESRINVLLTGIDSSERRHHALTDTLIVVSVDPVTGDVAMVSFPRDIARFTMSNGQLFTRQDQLAHERRRQPPGQISGRRAADADPGARLPPRRADPLLRGGRPRRLRGADRRRRRRRPSTTRRAINDPAYGGWTDGQVGFRLSAGVHHLDGETALAYARSRKGAGDNDFTRARRQQQLLLALRARLTDPSLLPQLPAIIEAGSKTLRTNFPRDRLQEMLDVGQEVESEEGIRQVVLGPAVREEPAAGHAGRLPAGPRHGPPRQAVDRAVRGRQQLRDRDAAEPSDTAG